MPSNKEASTDELAEILWKYNNLNQPLRQADAIFVLGSNDIQVAKRGAELFLQGLAPLIIFSGNEGRLTKTLFSEAEADVFADTALAMGVPREKIIIENQSTNTGENVRFVKKLLAEKNIALKNLIVVQKPYMGRRAFATIKQQWPEVDFIVTAPQMSFQEYPNKVLSKEHIINIMVGDTQRIREYPKRGFQIAQAIPAKVWAAWEELVHRGFNEHLII